MTCETYLPRIGGAEIHVKNLFERLLRNGHEVSLLTNERGPEMLGVTRIPWSKSESYKLCKAVWGQSKHVDLIHSHYCHRLALISGLVGLIRRKPVVVTLHGMGILDHPTASRWGRISHSFYRYWSLQFATQIISTSEDLAKVADKYISRKKMIVIMNGYDSHLFKKVEADSDSLTPDGNGKKIVMTVRRLVPKNGIQYLIEAVPQIVQKNNDVRFLLLGDGPLRERLEQRVQELHIENYVTFFGRISNDLVVEYLDNADVVVFPSTAESSSIACAEAMGMGKVVVASRVGGLVELLGKNEERGYLVNLVSWEGSNYDAPEQLPDLSYDNLARAVLQAIDDSNEGNTMKSTAAYEYATHYLSWDAIFENTESVYKNVIK